MPFALLCLGTVYDLSSSSYELELKKNPLIGIFSTKEIAENALHKYLADNSSVLESKYKDFVIIDTAMDTTIPYGCN